MPVDPEKYVADLARVLTEVLSDPEQARAYGLAGRERAITKFSGAQIASETRALYAEVAAQAR